MAHSPEMLFLEDAQQHLKRAVNKMLRGSGNLTKPALTW